MNLAHTEAGKRILELVQDSDDSAIRSVLVGMSMSELANLHEDFEAVWEFFGPEWERRGPLQ